MPTLPPVTGLTAWRANEIVGLPYFNLPNECKLPFFVMLKLKMTVVICYDKAATLRLVEKRKKQKSRGENPTAFFLFSI